MLVDPDGQAIAAAAEVAGTDVEVARARARLAWLQVRPLSSIEGVELLMHDSVLTLSAVRIDEHRLIYPLLPGTPTPALYLLGDGPLAGRTPPRVERLWTGRWAYQPDEQRAGHRRRSLVAVRAAQS